MIKKIERIYNKILLLTEQNEKFLFWFSILCFILLTIIGIHFHETFFDEAQAWLIAKNLNFSELLTYLKYEGHLFVWYTILMPFAKLGMPFPITIQVINWLFIFGAVLILWKKSPFNPIVKMLITFSVPICYQYAVMARCYSVGIFLLFLLISIFNERLKHPIIYSILIFLCANTCVPCLFAGFALGMIFLYDYIKGKTNIFKCKEFYFIIAIVLLCSFLVDYQLLGSNKFAHYFLNDKNIFISELLLIFTGEFVNYYIRIVILSLFMIFSLYTYCNYGRIMFFFTCSSFCLFALLYLLYTGARWHWYFFYIYSIISLWLYCNSCNIKNILYKCTNLFFIIILIFLNISTYKSYKLEILLPYQPGKIFVDEIVQNNYIQGNKKVYLCNVYSMALVPYFDQKGIDTYDCFTDKKAGFFNYKILYDYHPNYSSLINYNLRNKSSYLIFDYSINVKQMFNPKEWDVKLIHSSVPGFYCNTVYYLFEVTHKK